MSRYQNPRQKPTDPMPDRFDIEAGARCLYAEEGGSSLDLNISTQERTLRAYNSQAGAFERCARNGTVFEGDIPPGAWGPLVSPREARMAGSLHARLMCEREAWINRCREKIQEDIKESMERRAVEEAEATAHAEGEEACDSAAAATNTSEIQNNKPEQPDTPTDLNSDPPDNIRTSA